MKLRTMLIAGATTVAFMACEKVENQLTAPTPQVMQQQPPPVDMKKPTEPEQPTFDPVGVNMQPGANISLMPEPVEAPEVVRERRRMDIDQLDAAIKRVTGGVAWELNGVNQFEALASTLGKPDYMNTTQEDLVVSALFQKFLDDAARSVCFDLMDREVRARPNERVFFVKASPEDTIGAAPNKIVENLEYVLMRFHGRSMSSLGGEIEQWKWLYQSAEHIAQSPVDAWRTVCVAAINHPDFYTY